MGDEDRSAANIRTIEAEVNQLRQAMARKQDKASKQREDLLQSLRCQITDLQHEVALAQDEVKVRDKDLAACQLVVARLKAGEVQRLADISDLKAKLSVASEQGQSLRTSLEQAQKDLKIARDDQRSACIRAENSEKLQNEDIQRRESQFFQLIADKDAQLALQNEEIGRLKVDIQRAEDVKTQFSHLQLERQTLKSELLATKRALEASSRPIDSSLQEATLTRLVEDRLKSAEMLYLSTINDKSEAIEARDKLIRSLQFDIQACKQQFTHEQTLRSTESAANKREIAYLREKYELEMEHFREISAKQFENMERNYREQGERLNSRIGELIRDNERLGKRQGEATVLPVPLSNTTEIQQYRSQISSLQAEVADLRVAVQAKDQQVQAFRTKQALEVRLNTEKDELRIDLDYATSRLRILEVENARLQAEMKDAAELNKRSSLSLDSPDLKGSLRRLWESKTPVGQSAEVRGLEQENVQLKEIIAEMRTEMESIQNRIGSERLALAEKQTQAALRIEELETARNQLREDCERLTSDANRLQSDYFQAKREILQLTIERDQLIEISTSLRAELSLGEEGQVQSSAGVVALQGALDAIAKRTEVQPVNPLPALQVLTKKLYRPKPAVPKYEAFEEVREEEAVQSLLPKGNSDRETQSQKQQREQLAKKGGRPKVRNYNLKGEPGDFVL